MTHARVEDDWQTRLREEYAELDARVTKLGIFIETTTFKNLPFVDQGDLRHQYTAMTDYRRMLERRLRRLLPSDHPARGL